MKIEHIAITVSDLERAKDFFVKYFGCTLGTNYHNLRTGLHSCFVRFDGETRLELMQWEGIDVVPARLHDKTYFHLSISVGSKEQMDAMTTSLQADGYAIKSGPRTTGDGYYESVIALFDGIELEITT
jgi:lactoylglutathione lyase